MIAHLIVKTTNVMLWFTASLNNRLFGIVYSLCMNYKPARYLNVLLHVASLYAG